MINTDATFDKASGERALRLVCRDSEGTLLTTSTKRIFASSSLVAEALVVHEAMVMCKNLSLSSAIIETDNLTVIEACRRNIEKK